jgi:hypothetical protein
MVQTLGILRDQRGVEVPSSHRCACAQFLEELHAAYALGRACLRLIEWLWRLIADDVLQVHWSRI